MWRSPLKKAHSREARNETGYNQKNFGKYNKYYAKNSMIGSITQKTPPLFRHLFSNDIKLKQKRSSIFLVI